MQITKLKCIIENEKDNWAAGRNNLGFGLPPLSARQPGTGGAGGWERRLACWATVLPTTTQGGARGRASERGPVRPVGRGVWQWAARPV